MLEIHCGFGIHRQNYQNLQKSICSFLQCILLYHFVTERQTHHGGNGLLAGVVVSGGIVPDHLSILDVNTTTNTIDLKTQVRT